MRTCIGVSKRLLVVVLIGILVAPLPVSSAPTSLGTVRGMGAAKLSIDESKSWVPLGKGAQSFPLLQGVEVRSSSGSAVLELADGSRVNLLPFTAVRVAESAQTTEISILYGRSVFHLSPKSRVQFLTPSARLEPVSHQVMAGEVFVSGAGEMGLKMTQGDLRVIRLDDTRRVLLASREPVFLPERPAVRGALFNSDVSAVVPRDAKGVYAPTGQSVGYLTPGRNFVIYPGFTADLTRPFSGKLVQLAMAKIPEQDVANDAMPLFDVHGRYVGYVSGPVFYAQDTQKQEDQDDKDKAAAVPPEGEGGMTTGQITALSAVGVGLLGIGLGLGLAGGGGGGGGAAAPPPCATPPCP